VSWHLLRNDLQTQGNAGPHSFVGLLFSFQRPSRIPRSEELLSSRALTARSREDCRSASRRAASTTDRPGASRGKLENIVSNFFPTRGGHLLQPPASPVKFFRRPLLLRLSNRGALLLTPRGPSRQQPPGFSSTARRAFPRGGRVFYSGAPGLSSAGSHEKAGTAAGHSTA
jgi:hypothetical protein